MTPYTHRDRSIKIVAVLLWVKGQALSFWKNWNMLKNEVLTFIV